MSFASKHRSGQQALAATTLNTLVAASVVTGNTLTCGTLAPGSVSALVTATIVTGSLTVTPKWQASEDGTNFYDLSIVALPAISATGSRFVPLPDGSWRYVRLALTTAGATGGASDFYAISYSGDINPFYV